MLLEVRSASRKTPADGRFEISGGTARRLAALDAPVEIFLDDLSGTGRLEELSCTCQKAGAPHAHHFLVCDLFRTMIPERTYAVELTESRVVRVTSAHDGLR
ncbi:MAG: hypothetical protein U0132_12680 [Gemmatimonadaceae bacterium]